MQNTSLLRRNRQLLALSLVVVLVVGLASIWGGYQYFLTQAKQGFVTKQTALLKERIDKKQKILHGVMLTLAQTPSVQKALAFEDRDALAQALGPLRGQFAQWTGFENYGFHAITFDGRSLYRSYAPDSYGQDVSAHPLMQQAMADLSRPVTRLGQSGFGQAHRVISIQPVFAPDRKSVV